MQHTLGTLEFTGSEHWDPFNNIFLEHGLTRVCKPMQHVTSNNVGSCWLTMLCLFAQSLTFAQVYMYSSLTCLNKFLSFHFQQLLLECKKRKKSTRTNAHVLSFAHVLSCYCNNFIIT